MSRRPNTTTAPTGSIAPFGLRMLPALKDQVEAAAKENGRSMNAEIVARLQASFGAAVELPFAAQQAVDDYVEAHGGTPEEALVQLVLKGETSNAKVLNVTINPGATYQQFREFLKAAEGIVPEDVPVVMTNKRGGGITIKAERDK